MTLRNEPNLSSVELATVLVTDLVGSTRMATSVGPTRADELRDEHFVVLREAIALLDGREVKNTGDGLMVAFASASAAVQCAVLMQQLFERHYRHSGEPLHVRIGLGAGESTVQDGQYFGMPSIEATRLCENASADGILVSLMVKMLAGHADGVEFEPVGPLDLKGFPEPVEAFAVRWHPLADESGADIGRWPLPLELRSMPRVSYVGRTTEREQIERARMAARRGSRHIVLLSGEPGIGKTRLAAYAAHGARAEGFFVCWGGCSEELAIPYEPWMSVCTHLVEHMPQPILDRYVERFGGELSRLVRNLPQRVVDPPPPQPSDPETERFLLFGAVAGLLSHASEYLPLCVVLDDLHWGDGQTVALLKHVARTVNRGPLLLVAAYRESDLTRDHPLAGALADLGQVDGVERIALEGLRVDEVAQLMSAAAGHDLNEDGMALASEISSRTGGNPFFVGEVLRSLAESGLLVFDEREGRWNVDRSTAIRLPQGVRDVIERRIRRLGEEALDILSLAAVIGQSFDVELLSRLVDVDEDLLIDRLEAAVAASLLAESRDRAGRFSFSHALISQCLYEGMGTTRRARTHHRVAVALEELGSDERDERLVELALHWRLATASVDAPKAADYARRAGLHALASLAPAKAASLFGDAVELTADDTAERCQALVGLGEAQRQIGDAAYRQTLLDASRIASKLEDAELAANAALANNPGTYSLIGEVDVERLRAIERAIELDDPPLPARRARLLALQARELGWDPDVERRRAIADEAVTLARQAGDPRAQASVLRNAVLAYTAPDTLGLRTELGRELLDRAIESQDPALQFWAYVVQFNVAVERGDAAHAQSALQEMDRRARELGQPLLSWNCAYGHAGWALPRGELGAVESLIEHALQLGQQAGEQNAVLIYGAQLAYVRVYQGRAAEIIAILEQTVASYPEVSGWRAGLASTYCLIDEHSKGAAIVEQAARDRFADVSLDQGRTTSLALYADAAFEARLPHAAAILYELIEPWADQLVWNGATMLGHSRMWLGLLAATLGWHERTDQHLAFACEFQEANGLLLWATRAYLGWASALDRRGETGVAREKATRALELAREHGYTPFEARALALIAGERPNEALNTEAAR